ncbi:MAG: pentapeptide repeat-containing protein [Chloroflexota bacterium]
MDYMSLLNGEKDMAGASLSFDDLSYMDLKDVDFSAADLIGTDFTESDLRNAIFDDATMLLDAIFTNADLRGANLAEADLDEIESISGAIYDAATEWPADANYDGALYIGRGANLSNCNLTQKNLPNVDLTNADLQQANLSYAVFLGGNFTGAKLQKADLRGTDLTQAKMDGTTKIDGAIYNFATKWPAKFDYARAIATAPGANLKKINLRKLGLGKAQLQGADLTEATLENAFLGEANLSGADLRKADLERADLSGAKLDDAMLQGADLKSIKTDDKTSFTGAIYNEYTSWPSGYDYEKAGALPEQKYTLRRVLWEKTPYFYVQDNHYGKQRFYYLPESFQLSRQDDAGKSVLSLKFESPDGSKEKMKATLAFYGKPAVTQARLDAAKTALKSFADGKTPELHPLPKKAVSKATFYLELPNLAGEAKSQERVDAQIDPALGIHDTLVSSIDNFSAVYDALFSSKKKKTLFTGYVKFEFSGNDEITVPFEAQLQGNKKDIFKNIADMTFTTYRKKLTVKSYAAVFEKPDDKPDEQIISLQADFGQKTIELTAKSLEKNVTIQRPIQEIIVGQADTGIYKYELTVIQKNLKKKSYQQETQSEIVNLIPPDPNE